MLMLIFILAAAIIASATFEGVATLTLAHKDTLMVFKQTYLQVTAWIGLSILSIAAIYRVVFKAIYGISGWFNGYTTRKRAKAYQRAVKSYAQYIDGHNTLPAFKQAGKYLQDDKLYWLLAITTKDEDLAREAKYHLKEFDFVIDTVDELIKNKEYDQALSYLKQQEDSSSVLNAKYLCYMGLRKFDKARKLNINPREIAEEEIKLGINKLQNLKYLYQNHDQIKPYIEELIKEQKYSTAIEILGEQYQDLTVAPLFLQAYPATTPAQKFTNLSKIVKTDNPAGKYIMSIAAMDAGFLAIAHEHLLELAKTNPQLAFPMLGKLEKLEGNDKAASTWFEKALFGKAL